MSWHWKLSSEECGNEYFGPYDSKEEAEVGIKRTQAEAEKLNDAIDRWYSAPYEECSPHDPNWASLKIEWDGCEAYVDVSCRKCGTSGCVLAFNTEPTTNVNWS